MRVSALAVVLLLSSLATYSCHPDDTSIRPRRGPSSRHRQVDVSNSGSSSESGPDLEHRREKTTAPNNRHWGRNRPSPTASREEPQQEETEVTSEEAPSRHERGRRKFGNLASDNRSNSKQEDRVESTTISSRSRHRERTENKNNKQRQSPSNRREKFANKPKRTESDHDISEEDNYPEHFKQQILTSKKPSASSTVAPRSATSRTATTEVAAEAPVTPTPRTFSGQARARSLLLRSSANTPPAITKDLPSTEAEEGTEKPATPTPRVSPLLLARGRIPSLRLIVSTTEPPVTTTTQSAAAILKSRAALLRDSIKARANAKVKKEESSSEATDSDSSTSATREPEKAEKPLEHVTTVASVTSTTSNSLNGKHHGRGRNQHTSREIVTETSSTEVNPRARKISRGRSNSRAVEEQTTETTISSTTVSSSTARIQSRGRSLQKLVEERTTEGSDEDTKSTSTPRTREYIRKKNKIVERSTTEAPTSTSVSTSRTREYVRKKTNLKYLERTTESSVTLPTVTTPRREYVRRKSTFKFLEQSTEVPERVTSTTFRAPRGRESYARARSFPKITSSEELVTEASIRHTTERIFHDRKYTRTRTFSKSKEMEKTTALPSIRPIRGRKYGRTRIHRKSEDDDAPEVTVIVTPGETTLPTQEVEEAVTSQDEEYQTMESTVDDTTPAVTPRVRYSAKHRAIDLSSERKDINGSVKSKHLYSAKFRSNIFFGKSSTTPSSDDVAQVTEANEQEAARRLREKFPLLSSRMPSKRTNWLPTTTPINEAINDNSDSISKTTLLPDTLSLEYGVTNPIESPESDVVTEMPAYTAIPEILESVEKKNENLERVTISMLSTDDTNLAAFTEFAETSSPNNFPSDRENIIFSDVAVTQAPDLVSKSTNDSDEELFRNIFSSSNLENSDEFTKSNVQSNEAIPQISSEFVTESNLFIPAAEPSMIENDITTLPPPIENISSTPMTKHDVTTVKDDIDLKSSIIKDEPIYLLDIRGAKPDVEHKSNTTTTLQPKIEAISSTTMQPNIEPISSTTNVAIQSEIEPISSIATTIPPKVEPISSTTTTTMQPKIEPISSTTTTMQPKVEPISSTTTTTMQPKIESITSTTITTMQPKIEPITSTTTTMQPKIEPISSTTTTTTMQPKIEPISSTTSTTLQPKTEHTSSTTTFEPPIIKTATTPSHSTTEQYTTPKFEYTSRNPESTTSQLTSTIPWYEQPVINTDERRYLQPIIETTTSRIVLINGILRYITGEAPKPRYPSLFETTTIRNNFRSLNNEYHKPVFSNEIVSSSVPRTSTNNVLATTESNPSNTITQSTTPTFTVPYPQVTTTTNYPTTSLQTPMSYHPRFAMRIPIAPIGTMSSTPPPEPISSNRQAKEYSSIPKIITDAIITTYNSEKNLNSIKPPVSEDNSSIDTKTNIILESAVNSTIMVQEGSNPSATNNSVNHTTSTPLHLGETNDIENNRNNASSSKPVKYRLLTTDTPLPIHTTVRLTTELLFPNLDIHTENAVPKQVTSTVSTTTTHSTTSTTKAPHSTTVTPKPSSTTKATPPTTTKPTTTKATTKAPAPKPPQTTMSPVPKASPTKSLTPKPSTTKASAPKPQSTTKVPAPKPLSTTKAPAPKPPSTTKAPAPKPNPTTKTPAPKPNPTTKAPPKPSTTKTPVLKPTSTTKAPPSTAKTTTTKAPIATATTRSTTIAPAVSSKVKHAENVLAPVTNVRIEVPSEDSVGLTEQDLLILDLLSKQRLNTVESESVPSQPSEGLTLNDLLSETQRANNVHRAATSHPLTTERPRVAQPVDSSLFSIFRQIGAGSFGFPTPPVVSVRTQQIFPQETPTTRAPIAPISQTPQRTPKQQRTRPQTATVTDAPNLPQHTDSYETQVDTNNNQSALVTVAINVTRTVAGLMGRVLQGAARTVSAVVTDTGRVFTNYLQTWQIPARQ